MLTVDDVAKVANKRLRLDKDLVIAVTGDEGDGKSALAMGISLKVDPLFDFERNVLYSPTVEETKSKIIGLPRYSVIVADEAIKIMYKLNWGTKIQKFLNQIYALCRQENKLSILCMPRFKDFNEYFRNHRIKFWLHIVDPISNKKSKGHAILFGKSWNPTSQDTWWLGDLQKTIDKYSFKRKLHEVDYTLQDKIDVLSKSRNFLGVVEFEWIPDEQWNIYLEAKSRQKYDGMELNDVDADEFKLRESERLNKAMLELSKRGVTQKEIARAINMSQQSISHRLKELKSLL